MPEDKTEFVVTKTVRIGEDSFGMVRNSTLRKGFEFMYDPHDPTIKTYVKCGILKETGNSSSSTHVPDIHTDDEDSPEPDEE